MGTGFKGQDRLTTLPQVRDPEFMRGVLGELVDGMPIADVRVEMIRRRKRRCVLRYCVDSADGGGATFIGKVYKPGHGVPVSELMQTLWRHGFDRHSNDRISIPEVVAYRDDLSLLLQEQVGGRAVREYLRTPDAELAMRRMAQAVSKLHRTPVRVGEPYTLQDHLRRCHPTHEVLRARVPELRGAVDEIVHESGRLLDAYGECEATLIHGDLHMAQVHVAHDRTWMIDFDACATADPAADLGNVLVFIKDKRRVLPNAVQLADAFLDEYFKSMPNDILARVPLFEALTYLRRACKRVRLEEKNWLKKTRRSLDAGLQRLAVARA